MDNLKYFTEKELNKLFKAIHTDNGMYTIRNEAVFKLAYYCASRASEIGMFKVSDFNDVSGQIFCNRLKNGRNNTLRIIDADILRSLRRYLRNKIPHPESELLFCSQRGTPLGRKQLDKLMKYYCAKAKLNDPSRWHFHTLRHSRAVYMADHGCDIKDLMYWLGHRNIKNTMIYFDYTAKQQEALYRKLSMF